MKLSKRLECIAGFVSTGGTLADIGTDHGFIPIKTVLESKVKRALAMDVRKGPLEKAKINIRQYGLEDKIETRLSDGLDKLNEGEAETVLIAGMGGELIADILKRGDRLKFSVKEYILSPHSEWFKLRAFLRSNSYRIISEDMLVDEGKYYLIIKAVYDEGCIKESEEKYDLYGKYLIENKNPVLKAYLDRELGLKINISDTLKNVSESENAREKKESIQKEIELIKEVLYEMQ